MGKKSKRSRDTTTTTTTTTADSTTTTPACSTSPHPPIEFYPSDGPSDVELLQTTSASLQAKLDQLTQLGLADNRAGFVQQFVPLDLSPQDANAYLLDLTTAPEAQGQWRNLIAEIAAIRCGKGVDRIEGDQVTKATFYFSHPLLTECDREVAFCYKSSTSSGGGGEWRADG